MSGKITVKIIALSIWGLLLFSPFLFQDVRQIEVAARIAVFIVLVASYDLLIGYTGIVSFAHTMFFGLGAYAGALSQRHGVPMVPAWIVASVVVAAWSAIDISRFHIISSVMGSNSGSNCLDIPTDPLPFSLRRITA